MPKEINVVSPCGTYRFIRPQLAKGSHKGKDVLQNIEGSPDWVAEMKLDGHRMLLSSTCAWSRIGKDVANMEHFMEVCRPGILLDGELVPKHGKEGSDRVSTLRAHHPEALEYVAFDILYCDGEPVDHLPWCARRDLLERRVGKYNFSLFLNGMDDKAIRISDVFYMEQERVEDLMDMALLQGHEGVMFKHQDAPYKANSRSAWVKHKFTDTYDVVIVDCESRPSEWRVRPGHVGTDGVLYPEGQHTDPWLAGHVGLTYGFYDEHGTLHAIGSLGETGPREELEQYVGRVAEIKGYGQYPTGAIRHPVFERWREDKLPEDCIIHLD